MKKILITGGAGFVGSHLVEYCLELGHQVRVLDNFSKGYRSYLPKSNHLSVIDLDIRNYLDIKNNLDDFRPHIVFHLAAMHYIPECNANPQKALEINVLGTQNLLIALKSANLEHFVFTSSGIVYANLDKLLSEEDLINPGDIYAVSKYCGEQLCKMFAQQTNTPTSVARLFNVVGDRETNPHLIPSLISRIKKAKESKIIIGNTHTCRDYIDVRDVARALYAMSQQKTDKIFDVFNVGTGREYSVEDVIKLIEHLMNFKLSIEPDQSLKRVADRISQGADNQKIKSVLQWQPQFTLTDTLHDLLIKDGLITQPHKHG